MKVEYNGFKTDEFDAESTNDQILQTFLERHMVFDGDHLVIQWPDLKFEDLTVTRTPEELRIIGKQYLNDTDWYVARNSETGEEIPSDILAKRAQARIDASSE